MPVHEEHAERLGDFPLLLVTWVDATNIGHWTDLLDIPEFAREHGYVVTNVGYLVHEDDDCIVLAARMAVGGTHPEQVGLYERLPKSIIVRREVVRHGRSAVHGGAGRPPQRRGPRALFRL